MEIPNGDKPKGDLLHKAVRDGQWGLHIKRESKHRTVRHKRERRESSTSFRRQ